MDLPKKLVKKEWRLSFLDRIENTVHSMRLAEKIAWYLASFVFVVSALFITSEVNKQFLVEIPAKGGAYVEGIIGTPRFINPLLSVSDADRDLVALVYSGLVKENLDGTFTPSLAESYTVSEDGLTYTFTLKENLEWSDGKPLTAEDVAFTILKAQTPELKSSKRANWEGVVVKVESERVITFTLNQPYSAFLNNATIGILPKHIWGSMEVDEFPFSEFNINPVGTGPYEIKNIKRNSSGIPIAYELKANKDYVLGEPYIEKISIKFYQNEEQAIEALKNGEVEGLAGLSPHFASEIEKDFPSKRAPLTRLFGVFFNQNQNEVLLNELTRRALDQAIPKEKIIYEVLSGHGTVADSPIPPREISEINKTWSFNEASSTELALEILDEAGWKINEETSVAEKKSGGKTIELSLSLSTSNVPELVGTAKIIADAWKKIGAVVDLRVFESSDLNQNVIRPRKYDALLFGTVITNDADLYAFWHSSQRNDPGLNIAMYTDTNADKFLEDIRKENGPSVRNEKLEAFQGQIAEDHPAIFLYTPDFVYFVTEKIKNIKLGQITSQSNRFSNVNEWYVNTDNVWEIFAN